MKRSAHSLLLLVAGLLAAQLAHSPLSAAPAVKGLGDPGPLQSLAVEQAVSGKPIGQVVAPVDRNNRPLRPAAGGGAANIASRAE